MSNDKDYKILYIRVAEDLYEQISKNAKAHGLALNKYISLCVSQFEGKKIDTDEKNDKVLYFRVTEEEYNLIKREAKKYNMELYKFIKAAILNDIDVEITVNTSVKKRKVLYCRVTKDIHEKALKKARENNLSLTEYVTYCVMNFSDKNHG